MLLERDREFAQLAGLLADVPSSGGKVVLVRGEAGIGKTALVKEFVDSQGGEAHVHLGFCDDLLTPQPLAPFWDIAREEPSLAEALEKGDRLAVMAVLLELLSRGLRPTVLVLEDTQWADEVTLDAIRYLGRRIAGTNGLLVLTCRDGDVDYDHPLRQVIGELPPKSLTRIKLDGLTPQGVADLIGDDVADLDEIFALTDGNPLFVSEVIASGLEGVPMSVQDSVLARAVRLSPGARRVLELVSVVPGGAERSLIETILEPTAEQLVECARQELLQIDDDTVSFPHELTRQAVESALSPQERRRVNKEVLVALSDRAEPHLLVHHAREASDVESLIRYAPLAARLAMAAESHREAVAHFRVLDPYMDRIPIAERGAILDDWARSEFYMDNIEVFDVLERAIDLHRATGDQLALARLLVFAVRVYETHARSDSADAAAKELRTVLEGYPRSSEVALATSQLAWLAMMRGEYEPAVEFADRALVLAEAAGEDVAAISALNSKGYVMSIRGDPEGFKLLEKARVYAELSGNHFEETRALLNLAAAAWDLGEFDHVGEVALQARDTAVRFEIPILESAANVLYAQVLQWRGDWAAAVDTATEAATAASDYSRAIAEVVLGSVYTRRGRPEARALLDRAWSRVETTREIQNLCPAAAARAEHMWYNDERDPKALQRFDSVLDEARRAGRAWSAGELAFWLWKLGEISEPPAGIAEPYRLLMKGHVDEAAVTFEEKGMPYERALALMHGDESARLAALDIFDSLGADPIAARLRKLLRDDGVVVSRRRSRKTRAHVAGLTERQAEVLGLLSEGITNIQIADRLFVSPRTVENHVSAILTKLGSSTRSEAVQQARARGLVVGESATT
jgi:DNA-binding CsgD family transcriptional regulator/tetratricopeptide (TPR) repeat protein